VLTVSFLFFFCFFAYAFDSSFIFLNQTYSQLFWQKEDLEKRKLHTTTVIGLLFGSVVLLLMLLLLLLISETKFKKPMNNNIMKHQFSVQIMLTTLNTNF